MGGATAKAVVLPPDPFGETLEALMNGPESLLRLTGITKKFVGVTALDGVDFDVKPGELHVLFGENGAGKSTLINVIAGTLPPDGGVFEFRGEEVQGLTPSRARSMGISPVFQEFSLVPNLTVEENLFLGREKASGGIMNIAAMRIAARELIADLRFEIDPRALVDDLSRGHQQMAEIAKALLGDVKLLILDEPTASLTERETNRLFELLADLKRKKIGIIYVSHRMREIRALADRITILRDGRYIKTVSAANASDTELVELMTGRRIDVQFPKIDHRPTSLALAIEGLTLSDGTVHNVDFQAYAGEITGIAGLVGCGKSELIRAVYGLERIQAGTVRLNGVAYSHPSPRRSLSSGVAYFPANRVTEGLGLARTVRENVSAAALDVPKFAKLGFLRSKMERLEISRIMERMQLRPANVEAVVGTLSGGNRQKVVLGRALTRELALFLFDEPTVGIDVGAKLEVYQFMKALSEAGAAVIVVSSELPEVIALSNRLYVMRQGRMVAELCGDQKTEKRVLEGFFTETTSEAAQ